MNLITKIIIPSLLVLITACENNDDNLTPAETGLTVIDVITSDVDDGAYYYNFTSASEDSSAWHLSAQNIAVGNYFMPSIILDSTKVMVAVDTVNAFSDITAGPSSSSYSTSTGIVGYGGSQEVLNYSFTTHTVSASASTYFIYVLTTHKVYKIFFEEYSEGVVKFKYSEL